MRPVSPTGSKNPAVRPGGEEEKRAEESERVRLYARVTGRVQGVGFRWFCQRTACSRALGGWVRNRPDGSVEAEVEGPAGQVRIFLADLSRGPVGARVEQMITEHRVPEGSDAFTIR
jgi:acylphosphatase